QVELDQAGVGAVVLVPLQNGAVFHPRPLHRTDLDDRPVADHHATGVDAEVSGEGLQLVRVLDHVAGDVVDVGHRCRTPVVDLLAPGVLLAGREPERPGHVAYRRPRPVCDDVGHLCGV